MGQIGQIHCLWKGFLVVWQIPDRQEAAMFETLPAYRLRYYLQRNKHSHLKLLHFDMRPYPCLE